MPPTRSDVIYEMPISQASVSGASVSYGRHAAEISGVHASAASSNGQGSSVEARLLHAWKMPASPHLAAAAEGENSLEMPLRLSHSLDIPFP